MPPPGTQTGIKDRHGKIIRLGDRVRRDDGFEGPVVFKFGAFRFKIGDGEYLPYNSSLLHQEDGARRFEIINEG